MKILLASLVVVGFLGGCATSIPTGEIYTGGNFNNGNVTVDANATTVAATKTGKACVTSIFGLVATGDNSVDAAKRDGNISKVSSIDYKINNVIGLYGTYCTIVKGE